MEPSQGNIWLFVVSTLAFLAGLWVIYWIHNQHHLDIVVSPIPLPDSNELPLVSVIVPARNEARNIHRCVQALLGQVYPNMEIIVVEDRSTDETPQILEKILHANEPLSESPLQPTSSSPVPQLRVIPGEELPPGWAGKPHALVQGVEAARGEWLCFLDADTFATPDLLSSTIFKAQALEADLFTILTGQELGSFWEKAILPIVFTALSVGFPARRVNDPGRPDAIANGQFILIRRDAYEAVGGHRAVNDRIDEDKALAEIVKNAGYRLFIADGRQVAVTRMYTSLPEMWEGWTKNIFVGMRSRLGLLLFGAVLGLVGAVLLPVWLFSSTAWYVVDGGWIPAGIALEAVILWYSLIWFRVQAALAFRISPAYAFTLPLAALVFTAMMIASTYKVLSGQGVSWRGRTYRPV